MREGPSLHCLHHLEVLWTAEDRNTEDEVLWAYSSYLINTARRRPYQLGRLQGQTGTPSLKIGELWISFQYGLKYFVIPCVGSFFKLLQFMDNYEVASQSQAGYKCVVSTARSSPRPAANMMQCTGRYGIFTQTQP